MPQLTSSNLPSVDDEPPKPAPKVSKDRVTAKPAPAIPTAETANSKLDLAERLCIRLSRGEQLSADDFQLFDELGWDRRTIERETRRVASIAHLQATIGSKSLVEKRQAELAELTQVNGEQIAKLDAQIQAAMNERDKLAMAVRELETDVETRLNAMQQLRTKCPRHVLRVHTQLVGQLKSSTFNRSRLELQSKLRSLRGLPQTWSESDHVCIAAIIRATPSAELPKGIVNGRGQVHRDFWAKYAGERLAELPALEKRLADMETVYSSRMEEIDLCLDFYLI